MSPLQIKLRWLMVVVALVALTVGGLREHARLKRLSEEHCRRAIFFARRGEPYRPEPGPYPCRVGGAKSSPSGRPTRAHGSRRARGHHPRGAEGSGPITSRFGRSMNVPHDTPGSGSSPTHPSRSEGLSFAGRTGPAAAFWYHQVISRRAGPLSLGVRPPEASMSKRVTITTVLVAAPSGAADTPGRGCTREATPDSSRSGCSPLAARTAGSPPNRPRWHRTPKRVRKSSSRRAESSAAADPARHLVF